MSSDNDKDKKTSSFLNFTPFRTTAVKNIEAAYSRAGASNTHTPGVATKLGSQDQTSQHPDGHQGVGSQKFKESISDQRAEPTFIGKAFNNMINGTDRTK